MIITAIAKLIASIVVATVRFIWCFLVRISELFTKKSGRQRLICIYLPILIFIIILTNDTIVQYLENYMFKIGNILGMSNSFMDESTVIPFPKNMVFWLLLLIPFFIPFIPSCVLSLKSTNKTIKSIGIALPIFIYIIFCFFSNFALEALIVIILISIAFIYYMLNDYAKKYDQETWKSTEIFKEIFKSYNGVVCIIGIIFALQIIVAICAAIFYLVGKLVFKAA